MEWVLENGEKIVFAPKAKGGANVNKFAELHAKMEGLEVGKAFIATAEHGLTTEKKDGWDADHLVKLNTSKLTWRVNQYTKKLQLDEATKGRAYKCAEKDGNIYIGRTA